MDGIKQRRLAQGLTQAELARRVGCSFQHMNKVENGKTNPSIELSARIKDALDGKIVEDSYASRSRNFCIVDPVEKEDLRRIWLENWAPRREGEI